MDIFQAIGARKSVRTFDGRPLTEKDAHELSRVLKETESPFGGKIFTEIFSVGKEELKVPSTYGVIKGARSFILVAIDESDIERSTLSAGYVCEAAVLKATQIGAGTCWLGGTFSRKDFKPATAIPDGFRLIAVIPVGYPADKARFLERMMRRMAGSDGRKPFGELFYENSWGRPLPESSPLKPALDALRLAPSSTNSQPWRVIVCKNKAHFYFKPGMYALLDMGIGTYHFGVMCQSSVKWVEDPGAPVASSPYIYLCTALV